MAKNIVFCADGTWNGPDQDENKDGVPDATNVMRLFSRLAGQDSADSLRKQDEQERVLSVDGKIKQVSKYIHGVGDSRNPIKRFLGGVFGGGIVQRIVRGHTFISRHYEPNDRIFLIGFSRGAYTARALGGMIASVGLLTKDATLTDGSHDAEKAYRMSTHLWTQYRENAGKRSPLLGYVAEFAADPVSDNQVQAVDKIAAIAVWDTVGSLGIPIFKEKDGSLLDVYEFADRKLSSKVTRAFHALAIDEQRKHFEPTLWEPQNNIKQVWFAGAHSDVGGGYPDPCLSNLALQWMAGNLEQEGVIFDRLHDITSVDDFIPCHEPWKEKPFNAFLPQERVVNPPHAKFHKSVAWLMENFPGKYAPRTLEAYCEGGKLRPEFLEND